MIILCDALKLLCHKHMPPQNTVGIDYCQLSLSVCKVCISCREKSFHLFSLCNLKNFAALFSLILEMYDSISKRSPPPFNHDS